MVSLLDVTVDLKGSYTSSSLSDEEVVERILAGESSLFEVLMRRYNQRLYRVALGIVRSASEAEDIVQQAYVSAYLNLAQFGGRASFATWLTRIAVHEAFGRLRARKHRELSLDDGAGDCRDLSRLDPEQQASARELARRLEDACNDLPDAYRMVFMMRGVEEMSTAETAECLDMTEEAVRVRLHRARALLQVVLDDGAVVDARNAFSFLGAKCDAMVHAVRALLRLQPV